jgi:hypothetical protein
MEAVEKRKVSCDCRKLNSDSSKDILVISKFISLKKISGKISQSIKLLVVLCSTLIVGFDFSKFLRVLKRGHLFNDRRGLTN